MASGRLILVTGLPGAGKTTRARELESDLAGVRLDADDWLTDLALDRFDARARARVEALQWQHAQRLLELGATVILDRGLWTRAERDTLRDRAHELGASVELHFLDAPLDELWHRVRERDLQQHPDGRAITRAELETWAGLLEPPDPDELTERPAPPPRAADLEQARTLTREQLARALDLDPARIARLERDTDLYLATLASYLQAMGADLELAAAFTDGHVPLAIGALTTPTTVEDDAIEDPDSPVEPPPTSPATETRDARELLHLLIRAAVDDDVWSEREARVIALVAGDEHSVSQIATQLGISESAVKRTLRTAFGKLAGRVLTPGP